MLGGMELLELLFQILGCILECIEWGDLIIQFFGCIGLVVGNILTLGRVDWEHDDWQSILTGAITFTALVIIVIKCCLVAPDHAHSTSCVFAPGFSCA
jgi:hypothetical protein